MADGSPLLCDEVQQGILFDMKQTKREVPENSKERAGLIWNRRSLRTRLSVYLGNGTSKKSLEWPLNLSLKL